MSNSARVVLAVVMHAAMAASAIAATHAVVVGIDRYDAEVSLNGAVNDATDIAAALDARGAEHIELLLDYDADRAAIESALKQAIDRANPGDTVLFTYSGHGSYAPAWDDLSEADGRDEFLLLSRFDRSNPQQTGDERIVDHELLSWLQAAHRKQVSTIVVADSCYSGGMSRGLTLNTRAAPPVVVPLPPPSDSRDSRGGSEPDTDLATFISGALESQLVYEVLIDGRPRGALSYAFARALEGRADADGDGIVVRGELQDYVAAVVQARAAALQAPEFLPGSQRGANRPLFAGARVVSADPSVSVPEIDVVAINEVDGSSTSAIAASFVWNETTGQLVTPLGDVAASGLRPDQLATVIDKFRLVALFEQLTVAASTSIGMAPFQQIFDAGDRVTLIVDIPSGRDVLVLDLTNDGSVQFLGTYSDAAESRTVASFEVVPPFGADHLVAIALPHADAARATVLLDGPGLTATMLVDLLPPLLANARIGVQPFFTRSGEP